MKQIISIIIFSTIFLGCKKEEASITAIEISPTSLSFGDVDISTGATRSFSIKNTGTETINVNDITCSDNYYVDWDNGSIPPNGSQLVNVAFWPDGNLQYNGQITITSNTDTKFVTLSGKGICNGKGTLEFSNLSQTTHKVMIDGINYGQINAGETKYYYLPAGIHSISQPRLDGTGGCSSGNVTIIECGTHSYYCDWN